MSNIQPSNAPGQVIEAGPSLISRLRTAASEWRAARRMAWEAERLSNRHREDAGLLRVAQVDGVVSGRRPYPTASANDARGARRLRACG